MFLRSHLFEVTLHELAFMSIMQDPYRDINATAKGPTDGLQKLKELISNHIYRLNVPQTYKHTVRNQTSQWIDAWKWYQGDQDRAVEVWAQFWLYRNDGNLQWDIKVVWGTWICYFPLSIILPLYQTKRRGSLLTMLDSDGPDSKNSHAHYGYEIYLNGERQAGPGHVNFTNFTLSHIRDGEKMHEVHKGIIAEQIWDAPDRGQFRLDCALRLWSCGKDVEIDQASGSDQEYYQMLWRAPAGWERFPRPSFGQMA